MLPAQPAILSPLPPLARSLTFVPASGFQARRVLGKLAALDLSDEVVGLGASLAAAANGSVPGLHDMPVFTGARYPAPSTPASLWVWLRGTDRGELIHRGRAWEQRLAGDLRLSQVRDTFVHRGGRDLSGYEDGTENPKGTAALEAALVSAGGPGLEGSSFVAVQSWEHDLNALAAMSSQERDHTVGRRQSDNEELPDAPPSAHVKRSAQESFEPEAFMWRRSMPYAEGPREGLLFVAFGRSFDAFEAISKRMLGVEDGILDALFRFSRPIDGSYFWCPPVIGGHLDLSALHG